MPWTWTEERVEMLKKLWDEGFPIARIAREFGDLTAAAVIGKVHRLGLSRRRKTYLLQHKKKPRAPRTRSFNTDTSQRVIDKLSRRADAIAKEVAIEPEVPDHTIPIQQRRTLLTLTDSVCKWPVGDPASAEFFFCGGKRAAGATYCAYHYRIAHQPAVARQRDRRLACI